MPVARDLLEDLLDSWDRNNTILVNLLNAIPEDALGLRPMEGSPTIAALFTHMHYCRLIFVQEDVPECALPIPTREWRQEERDRGVISRSLNESVAAVRQAVRRKLESGGEMQVHYDHPLLMLQHLIWHEGYHHGQIKLTLKLAGRPLSDDDVGLITWDVWMDKR